MSRGRHGCHGVQVHFRRGPTAAVDVSGDDVVGMGKSNPTYRNLLEEFCDDLEPFRRTAFREYQPAFDRALLHARFYAAAAGQVNHTDFEKMALFSMIVGLQHEVLELREELGLPTDEPIGYGKQSF